MHISGEEVLFVSYAKVTLLQACLSKELYNGNITPCVLQLKFLALNLSMLLTFYQQTYKEEEEEKV